MSPLFSPGCLYITAGVSELIRQGTDITPYLSRHFRGDWGDIGQEDKAANHHALKYNGRLLSAYHITPDITLWILTQQGSTTVMYPYEY
jgi:hypothetical protein